MEIKIGKQCSASPIEILTERILAEKNQDVFLQFFQFDVRHFLQDNCVTFPSKNNLYRAWKNIF
jgi:hypothetical protein